MKTYLDTEIAVIFQDKTSGELIKQPFKKIIKDPSVDELRQLAQICERLFPRELSPLAIIETTRKIQRL
ncbi:hypothetical protein [Enterococcus mediterraneensis]|uniref:hypothetical protein n=1 Tax=Enterococcus mediterraneensis TaxID=2364791 RepID=UPI000F05F57C|nr:hypothetical protein [Enterococcus mediterraneensis]